MKYNIIIVLLFFLFSCAQEQEVENRVEQKDIDARLNQYWDFFEVHKIAMPDSGLYYMEEVRILAESAGKSAWVAAAYGASGDIYRREGRLGESVFYYLRAIKLLKEQGDLRQLARNYNNLALIYEETEDYDKAIFYALQAKDIFFYEGSSYDKANIYRNLAIYHSNLGQFEEAEKFILLAEEIAPKAQDYSMLSRIYNTHGVINFKKENYEQAREYYHKALQYSDSIEDDLWVKAAATNNIFEAYSIERKYTEAENWLGKTLSLKEQLADPVSTQITLNLYGEMLIEQGRHKRAVDVLMDNFSRTGLTKTSVAFDEGLSLVQEALTKIAENNRADNAVYLSRNFALLHDYSKEYTARARQLRKEVESLSKQLSVAANVEKYIQQEESERVARKNLYILLLTISMLLCVAVVMGIMIRKNRRYKQLYAKVEDILNSQALRHIRKG